MSRSCPPLLLLTLLLACGSDDGGEGGASTISSSSSSSSGSTSSGTASSSSGGTSSGGTSSGGVDPKQATCEAVAKKVTACCPSGVPNCQPDQEQGWVQWCLSSWDACPQSFQCQAATAGCDTSQCPDFGNGGCG